LSEWVLGANRTVIKTKITKKFAACPSESFPYTRLGGKSKTVVITDHDTVIFNKRQGQGQKTRAVVRGGMIFCRVVLVLF
jgi:hypothetical protein